MNAKTWWCIALSILSVGLSSAVSAEPVTALTLQNSDGSEQSLAINIQVLLLMTALTLLPSMLIMLTAFTRIVVVFAILRQALGLQQTPSNQILVGLALFLSIFVMLPVLQEVNDTAVQPYLEEQIEMPAAIVQAGGPVRQFMLNQMRESDLNMFMTIAGQDGASDTSEVSFFVLVPAFMTSELKTAFQIGFMLFVPFLIIDMVVASVLMSMGMLMLSPLIVSLPFKLMLFVLVDGWVLVMGALTSSFG